MMCAAKIRIAPFSARISSRTSPMCLCLASTHTVRWRFWRTTYPPTMAKKKAKEPRPANGEGRGFNALISFNPNEPGEARAREFAKRLSKTKKLSGMVKGILDGLAAYEEHTGVLLTPEKAIGLMFSGGIVRNGYD